MNGKVPSAGERNNFLPAPRRMKNAALIVFINLSIPVQSFAPENLGTVEEIWGQILGQMCQEEPP
jgi:hypothetical protein